MAGSQVTVAVTQVEEQRKGYNGITLTQFANDTTEPEIAAGSVVEVAGALYEFTVQEAIAGFAGIGNDLTAYIELTAAGASITAAWTTRTPAWDDYSQGFYDGSLVRHVGGVYKDGSASPTNKFLLTEPNVLLLRKYGNGGMQVPGLMEVLGDLRVTGPLSALSSATVAGAATVFGDATVGGHATVGGDATVAGDLNLTNPDPYIACVGPIDIQRGHYRNHFYDASSPTQDNIYEFLAHVIPEIDSSVVLSGEVGTSATTTLHAAYATRLTSVSITIFGGLATAASPPLYQADAYHFYNDNASTLEYAALAF